MRKNFTQKFLTIFVFLTVYAFGFKAYAQPPAADCSIDYAGEIFASDTVLCPGGNPTIIFGDGTASSDPGFGNGGGPQVTYRWFFRSSPNATFIPVNSTVIQPGSSSADPEFNGRGSNFNPGPLTGLYDFVRYRYSGSELSPEACFKASNIVSIRALDREKPFIITCVSSFVVDNQAGSCYSDAVSLPAPGNFGPVPNRNTAFGVYATDNCTTGNTTANTLRLSYFLTNGTQIANNANRTYNFPIGRTEVVLRVTDSSGNFEECPFFVTVRDTSKPIFTGPADFARFTEPGFCSANITVSEFRPTFDACTGQPNPPSTTQSAPRTVFTGDGNVITSTRIVKLTYTIKDSTGALVSQSPLTGINFVPDTRLRRGFYNIRYDATDSSGNTEFDTLFVRVIDNINPVIVKVNGNTNHSIGDRIYAVSSTTCSRTAVDLLNNESGNPNSNGLGGFLDTIPTVNENCGVRRVFITGPNDFSKPFNTAGVGYNNTVFNLGTSTLQYVAEDSSGNRSVMVTQTVTLIDQTKPNVFCPANETRNTSGDPQVTAVGCTYRLPDLPVTFNDPNNCSSSSNAAFGPNGPQGPNGIKFLRYYYFMNGASYFDTLVRVSSGATSMMITKPFRIGVTTVKTVAYDTTGTTGATFGANNASDTCSFIVTINDNTPPTFTTQSATVTLQPNGSGVLTPSMVVATSFDCLPKANGQGFALSQTTFSCSDIGTRTVTITYTDSSGNVSAPQTATVTVRSGITATATTTGAFCTGGTLTLSAPTGGTAPYTYNVIGSSPSDSTDGDADGSYVNLLPGVYTVRISDANGCYSDITATVGTAQKNTTDISITATAADNFFTAPGDMRVISVNVREIGGFAANSIAVRVAKAQLGNYSLTLGSGVTGWVRTENASVITFTRTGSFACGANEVLTLNMTRNDAIVRPGFGVTFSVIAPPEQAAEYRYNDSFSVLFVAQ